MLTGITLKVVSALVFTMMAGLVRWVGDTVPPGQVVFARSLFAMIPILIWLAWRSEIASAVRTRNVAGHLGRTFIGVGSMFLGFMALSRLPLTDAIAIGYASPLITVVLAVLVLHERVRVYRWSAVGVGLVGVVVILWPHLAGGALAKAVSGTGEDAATAQGALLALAGAFCTAGAMIQVRRLTQTESTAAIVFYFSAFSTLLSLFTIPTGWVWPGVELALVLVLIGCLGGVGQILLTKSYRYADASLIAPFEYTTILWALMIGWIAFGDLPGPLVLAGASIVVASGIFVILRERQLGIERARARKATPPPG